jgi:GNAT superfamily N-acetyltransferase
MRPFLTQAEQFTWRMAAEDCPGSGRASRNEHDGRTTECHECGKTVRINQYAGMHKHRAGSQERQANSRVAGLSDDDLFKYTSGQCGTWAAGHQRAHPHLQFGIQWGKVDSSHPDWEDIVEENELDPDDTGQVFWQPQHIFTHDDMYAYDVLGAHPLSAMNASSWDDVTFNHTREDMANLGTEDIGGKYPHPDALGMIDWDHLPNPDWYQHNSPTPGDSLRQANSHLAAVNQEMVDSLNTQFHDWWKQQDNSGGSADDMAQMDFMNEDRGPIGHWPNIENFLKEKYPAAHQGLGTGMEAEWSLDGHAKPYLTGPAAIKQHGYDPAEISAAMLLLHNQSDPFRGDMAQQDQDRLNDIAQKRYKMQRNYDSRQLQPAAKELVTANWRIAMPWYRIAGFDPRQVVKQLGGEFRDWAAENQHRLHETAPYPPERHWKNIEMFLHDNYPAAHKGFSKGMEGAQQMLDRRKNRTVYGETPEEDRVITPYKTGPEAVARYGYDPAEIAAGALFLHNNSHPFRMEWSNDIDRLSDIFQKRQQMQRDYEKKQQVPQPITAALELLRIVATAPTLPQTGIIEPPQDLSPEDERRVISEINDHLSYSRPRAAAELWAQSGIPLSNLTRSREIASCIRVWGLPEHAQNDWAQAELDDYHAEQSQRSRPDYERLYFGDPADAQWDDDEDISFNESGDDECYWCGHDQGQEWDSNHTAYPTPTNYCGDNCWQAWRAAGSPNRSSPSSVGPGQVRFDPNAPVENTTDPNAKLKSPWYKKVQHYPSGQLPAEFARRNLYRDFHFGNPSIATTDPNGTYYRVNPDAGVYQINDSRRPLHNPPVGYVHYEADHPNQTVRIRYLDVHPQKRGQGVATALISALAEDFPDYKIDPGTTTPHGTGFVNYMRQNAPNAQERLDTQHWSPNPANRLTNEQLNSWGVSQRRSPVFAFIAQHNSRVAARQSVREAMTLLGFILPGHE